MGIMFAVYMLLNTGPSPLAGVIPGDRWLVCAALWAACPGEGMSSDDGWREE